MEMFAWGIGGAVAATSLVLFSVELLSFAGMGLQGVALYLFPYVGVSGISSTVGGISTDLWTLGSWSIGSSSVTLTWLFSSKSTTNIVNGSISVRRLQNSNPDSIDEISPYEVYNHTLGEIHDRAVDLGLKPMGKDPINGQGSYIDPRTGIQRILIHPNSQKPFPHAHVNNPLGQRINLAGKVVPREAIEAHIEIRIK